MHSLLVRVKTYSLDNCLPAKMHGSHWSLFLETFVIFRINWKHFLSLIKSLHCTGPHFTTLKNASLGFVCFSGSLTLWSTFESSRLRTNLQHLTVRLLMHLMHLNSEAIWSNFEDGSLSWTFSHMVSRYLPIRLTPIRLLPFDLCLSRKRLSRLVPISCQILNEDFCLSVEDRSLLS